MHSSTVTEIALNWIVWEWRGVAVLYFVGTRKIGVKIASPVLPSTVVFSAPEDFLSVICAMKVA